jgi:hypothetical protein
VIQTQAALLTPDTVDLSTEETENLEDTETTTDTPSKKEEVDDEDEIIDVTPTKQTVQPTDQVNKTPSGKSIITRSVLKPRPVESSEEPKIPDKDPLAMDEDKIIKNDSDDDEDDDDEKPLVIDELKDEKPVKEPKVIE